MSQKQQQQQLKPTQEYRAQANNILSCRNLPEETLRDIIIQALETADITGQRLAFASETGIFIPAGKVQK